MIDPRPTTVPAGLEDLHTASARAWVAADVRDWVESAIARHGSVYDAARRETDGRAHLHGRAPVYLVPADHPRWAVRHYVRGGAVASALGDRYVRFGIPRPFREAYASLWVRDERIPTPAIGAAVVYPSGLFYRADLMTEYVPASLDLAELLFETDRDGADPVLRVEALEQSGRVVRRLAAAGIQHPDLNVKNLLVQHSGSDLLVHLVDLDGCRLRGRASEERLRRRMANRLDRSLVKWQARTGRALGARERAALEGGLRGDPTC